MRRASAQPSWSKRVGSVLLLTLLIWRCANAAWIVLSDHSSRSAPSFLDTSDRLRNGLLVPSPGTRIDLAYDHLRMVWEHVPESAKIYYLQDFAGARDLGEFRRFFRLRELLYPRYAQPIDSLPLPPSAIRGPLRDKPTFVFDLTGADEDCRRSGFTKVVEYAGATLWRESWSP